MPVFFKLTCKADFDSKDILMQQNLLAHPRENATYCGKKCFWFALNFTYLFVCFFGTPFDAQWWVGVYWHQHSCYKNCTISLHLLRNKNFLFVKIETWNFVRFHEILCSSLYMANIVLFYSFLIQVEIKKKYYWICSLSPSNGLKLQQIEQDLNRCHYPLYNHLS